MADVGLLLFFQWTFFPCLPPARTTADGQATQRDFFFFFVGVVSSRGREAGNPAIWKSWGFGNQGKQSKF